MSDVLHSFIGDEDNVARIKATATMMIDALKNGHKIISCGNGGSMCDASHFSEAAGPIPAKPGSLCRP